MDVPSARSLALLLSLALLVFTPGCRRTEQDQRPTPARAAPDRAKDPEKPWYNLHTDILFHKAGAQELRLDLYVPRESAALPATILYIHGGGWHQGSRRACPAESLVAAGFAVACADYRLSGVAPFPAQLHDVRAAVRWLQRNAVRYKLAPRKIGAFGLSAGAHLALLLGTAADVKELRQQEGEAAPRHNVQAVAAWFPPTDFINVDYPQHLEYADAVVRLLRLPNIKALKEMAPRARLASPLYHVTEDDAPTLLMHGARDTVVPVGQSRAMHKALTAAGVESAYRELPEGTHGGGFGRDQEREVQDFFLRHLGGQKATHPPTPR